MSGKVGGCDLSGRGLGVTHQAGLLLGQQACFWILGVGGAHVNPGSLLECGQGWAGALGPL